MLLMLSILWGGSFFFIGIAVAELPTFTIVFLRVGIAALGQYLVMRVMGEHMPGGLKVWRAFFVMGFLNNLIPFSLIAWGQSHVESGLASILLATTLLFSVVVAHYLTTDGRLSAGRIAGIIAGIAGVVILIGSDVFSSLGIAFVGHIGLLGAAFLAERLEANHFIGMAVIGIGLAAIDGRIVKMLRRSRKRA
jgi:drug/metabolite transporter (DMT)-like permease